MFTSERVDWSTYAYLFLLLGLVVAVLNIQRQDMERVKGNF